MRNMIIIPNYSPYSPRQLPPCFTTPERAIQWTASNIVRGRFKLACDDLAQHIFSYRQREDGTLKPTFWKRYLTAEQYYLEMLDMPRPKQAPKRDYEGSLTFLNMRLTEEQLTEFDELKLSNAAVLGGLEKALQSGLALSFSYNAERKTANAYFADRNPDSATKGYALGAFSDNCLDALKLLLYKHHILLTEDWQPLIGAEPARRNRG